jgi:hypothetical protein
MGLKEGVLHHLVYNLAETPGHVSLTRECCASATSQ